MPGKQILSSRKSDHIRINLEEDVRSGLTTGLEQYRFIHRALPEMDLEDVNLGQTLFGRRLDAPLLISSMTGGTTEAAAINRKLAEAAQEMHVAMGLGSQRTAIENPAEVYSFQVRKYAPDILLFANLGAVQLNYTYTSVHCRRAVDMVGADALYLHLNALQEALQPEGDTRFAGLLGKIETVCKQVGVPVIVKEVGWGISETDARRLYECGVAGIDVAGAGGTSWSQVEMYRIDDESLARVAAAFRDWGIPTAESIRQVRQGAPDLPVFASGGLRNGIDVAKCIALGAVLGGMAGPYLKAAAVSAAATVRLIAEFRREIQVAMFACGAANIDELNHTPLLYRSSGDS
ncbi:MAG: type 2 isopentenyl-diphosphate Delta-isomerase [Anaerolineaceae bacterium]|nr:type 2 isopentenyl-diphosphate Delta-isomerase [Anaerolineaceae bacterium]